MAAGVPKNPFFNHFREEKLKFQLFKLTVFSSERIKNKSRHSYCQHWIEES